MYVPVDVSTVYNASHNIMVGLSQEKPLVDRRNSFELSNSKKRAKWIESNRSSCNHE
jgi:hypothetical protein